MSATGSKVLGDRDGRVLRIRDVARIEDGKEIAETAAIHDGRAAVMLSIRKQSGSNSVAFVAGMIPLAVSNGVGAGFNRATAGVIVGGQVLSLLLTLLATPAVYSLFDDAGIWLKKRFGRFFEAEPAELSGKLHLAPPA